MTVPPFLAVPVIAALAVLSLVLLLRNERMGRQAVAGRHRLGARRTVAALVVLAITLATGGPILAAPVADEPVVAGDSATSTRTRSPS